MRGIICLGRVWFISKSSATAVSLSHHISREAHNIYS